MHFKSKHFRWHGHGAFKFGQMHERLGASCIIVWYVD